MGSTVRMIEKHYGSLLDGAADAITGRLDRFDQADEETETETS